jgi:hypothetical protein
MYPKIFLSLLALLMACSPQLVGDPCLLSVCDIDSPPDNANSLCEPTSECPALLCIGQGRGLGTGIVDSFCSVDCDTSDDCPDGFVCASAATIGNNANRPVCLKE